MKTLLAVLGVASLAIVTTLCGQGHSGGTQVPPLLARSALPVLGPAPQWTLTDIEGREVKASDFKGKVVVIDFWATWCPPCVREIPDYVSWQTKYADRGLVILGFSMDEAPASELKVFAQRMKMNYPILMADDKTAELFGGIQGLPTAFVIDREGNLRYTKVGLTDPEAYEKLITSLL